MRRRGSRTSSPGPCATALANRRQLEAHVSDLVSAGTAMSWLPGVYEPETTASGGTSARDFAHDLFHADSRAHLPWARSPAATTATPTASPSALPAPPREA
ncbi:lantibiotic dehydratase C-terminal domain-containing protein [Streptomyces sp. IBSBF 3136]|uniref:lantibiotic dehydratase C-terminal domain-containing protein n=1 Tax=Streptomyces sp. IBSBF 3136 TaxID=2903524 RepID=UPI003FA68EB4